MHLARSQWLPGEKDTYTRIRMETRCDAEVTMSPVNGSESAGQAAQPPALLGSARWDLSGGPGAGGRTLLGQLKDGSLRRAVPAAS